MAHHLITGGSGFVGSHLTGALLARGDTVTVLDDPSTGSPANLRHLRGHPSLRLVQGSVHDGPLLDELVSGCDAVVHLAEGGAVLDAARHHSRKVLVGTADHTPRDTPAGATSRTEKDLLVVVARLFDVAGPRQGDEHIVPRLIRQALSGMDLVVLGDGSQVRCFTHVRDVVEALTLLLDEPFALGGIFDVGADDEVTVLELAKAVVELAGSASGITFHGSVAEPAARVADSSRLRALTGWRPRRNLDEILLDTISEARVR
ncbi:NAD-dependent epimerase/dehydratase family protein [Herbidospora mongoliensis]|uniref:NAD-dependent epimerase/dehydratase family protein n=1 Tax=Herbidospora mongoliensis TaxID=688067 RepID=UPI00082AC76A|nr:NAD-dependent epimerase/dehydratase family protein [Herbidospora mongoliensis]